MPEQKQASRSVTEPIRTILEEVDVTKGMVALWLSCGNHRRAASCYRRAKRMEARAMSLTV